MSTSKHTKDRRPLAKHLHYYFASSMHFRTPDIQNAKMSFASLPIEIITHIFDLLDESDVEMPLEIDKHRKMCKALMALRLTCKELGDIATRQLFRTLYVSPSRRSWLNAHTVAANQELRVHLQTLAIDRYTDGASHEQKIQDAIKSPRLGFLDFSLFPNLKVLKADDKWMIRKKTRSNVEISLGCCGIYLTAYGSLMKGFEEIGRYGFSLASVSIGLDDDLWWPTKSVDLSGLRYLRLSFGMVEWYELSLETDLDHLTQLPNLEEFHMDQFFSRRSDDSQNLDEMTNVLKLLANVRNWPRLRHLDLRYLITTVEDLKAFVTPHAAAGTLKMFEIHGDLICAQVTADEKQKRVDLLHWIKTVICPEGGGVTFKHVLGSPKELYGSEYSLSSTEGGDTDAEDTEEYNPENGPSEEENTEE